MSVNLNRQFKSELNTFANKNVVITTTSGEKISGTLIGLNTEDLSIILGNAVADDKHHHRIFLSGSVVAEIVLGEAPFDMQGLRTELEKVFKKTGVRYYDDTRTIMVMDRFRVSEEGVEGEGPVADRIRRIWQGFVKSGGTEDTSEQED